MTPVRTTCFDVMGTPHSAHTVHLCVSNDVTNSHYFLRSVRVNCLVSVGEVAFLCMRHELLYKCHRDEFMALSFKEKFSCHWDQHHMYFLPMLKA
jgi:hypothetical protein